MIEPIPLLVFAKAPRAGKVKTRLQTHCSAEQAAQIAKILLNECLRRVCAYWPSEVRLCVWPSMDDPFLIELAEKYSVTLCLQGEGDLGQKMHVGLHTHGYPAAIIGADASLIERDALQKAHRQLQAGQNAIGPAEDGGYYLIGLSQSAPALFSGLNWGQSTVFEQTISIANKHDISLNHLPKQHDIDVWSDLLRAKSKISPLNDYLIEQELIR